MNTIKLSLMPLTILMIVTGLLGCEKLEKDDPSNVDSLSTSVDTTSLFKGLIGYYPFNGTANDRSAYNNNGQLVGPIMTSGHHDNYSSAYTFNSNYIEIKNTPSLNPTKGISIAAWIKLNEYVDNQNFVSKANINKEEPHVSYSLKMGDPGINTKVQFSVALNNLRHNVFSKQAIPLNEWVFLVGVYDGASLHIYINGKLDNSTKASGLISTFNTNVNMGRWSGDIANNPQYLQGSLDDVRMYNRALTQKEIEYLSGL